MQIDSCEEIYPDIEKVRDTALCMWKECLAILGGECLAILGGASQVVALVAEFYKHLANDQKYRSWVTVETCVMRLRIHFC